MCYSVGRIQSMYRNGRADAFEEHYICPDDHIVLQYLELERAYFRNMITSILSVIPHGVYKPI